MKKLCMLLPTNYKAIKRNQKKTNKQQNLINRTILSMPFEHFILYLFI